MTRINLNKKEFFFFQKNVIYLFLIKIIIIDILQKTAYNHMNYKNQPYIPYVHFCIIIYHYLLFITLLFMHFENKFYFIFIYNATQCKCINK